jgi:ornithine cyclodeaminase
MLILNQADVRRLLPMRECVDVMAATLATLARGEAAMPLRTVMRVPNSRDFFAVMPAFLSEPRSLGAKVITVFPGNHGTALDSHQGAVLLFDAKDGSLVALLDATAVTTIRTAAVSAVATRLLAREGPAEVAILGAGVQGHSHLEAMHAVRTIAKLHVWSRSTDHARALVRLATERMGLDARVAGSAEQAVRASSIICTTTASAEPVLLGEWLTPGSHVNAIGASTPNAREVDTAAVVRARLYVDRRESALNEPGDILVPLKSGAITADHIRGEIGELLLGRAEGRTNGTDITLFKSLGLAVEDLGAACHVYAKAVREGAGVRVALGGARDAAH